MEIDKEKRYESFEEKAKQYNKNIQEAFREQVEKMVSSDASIELLKLMYKSFNNIPAFESLNERLLFKEGRMSFYNELRPFIPKEVLVKIEIYND